MEFMRTQVFNSHELFVSFGKKKPNKKPCKIISAQIQIHIIFSEPKYTDYIKLSLLSGIKLFDSVFKMVEMQFSAVISNTPKFIIFYI